MKKEKTPQLYVYRKTRRRHFGMNKCSSSCFVGYTDDECAWICRLFFSHISEVGRHNSCGIVDHLLLCCDYPRPAPLCWCSWRSRQLVPSSEGTTTFKSEDTRISVSAYDRAPIPDLSLTDQFFIKGELSEPKILRLVDKPAGPIKQQYQVHIWTVRGV